MADREPTEGRREATPGASSSEGFTPGTTGSSGASPNTPPDASSESFTSASSGESSFSEGSYSEGSFSEPSSFSAEPSMGGEATSWEEASLPPWSDRTGERTQLVEPQDLPGDSPWVSSSGDLAGDPIPAREAASAILSQQGLQQPGPGLQQHGLQQPGPGLQQQGLQQPGLSQSVAAGPSQQGLSQQRSGMDDFFGTPHQAAGQAAGQAAPARSDRNLVTAIITGAVLIAVAWSMFAIGKVATLVFTTIVLVVGIAELYSALNKVRYHPASLIGYAAPSAFRSACIGRAPTPTRSC